jgi:DNA-binding CsgD family transcriptional regulator
MLKYGLNESDSAADGHTGERNVTLQDDIARVSVRTMSDIRPASEALRDMVERNAPTFRIAITDNICSKRPMVDDEGNTLSSEVFGFVSDEERQWSEHRVALSSPLLRACRYESEPFWANEEGFRTQQPNPYLDGIDLSNFDKRAMCHAAVVIPVHLPFGQIGVAVIGSARNQSDLSEVYENFADEWGVWVHRFLAGYVKLMRTRKWLPMDCQLTKREVECLRWAAVGKTDKEISLILARSHATVRFHIQNAGEKLDAVNRSQTIFKAAQLGYLGLAA